MKNSAVAEHAWENHHPIRHQCWIEPEDKGNYCWKEAVHTQMTPTDT